MFYTIVLHFEGTVEMIFLGLLNYLLVFEIVWVAL